MGLDLSLLYLRGSDPERLSSAVGPAWEALVKGDTDNSARQIAVLITPGPWMALIDSAKAVPRELGTALTGAAGGESAWISVSNTVLGFGVLITRDGKVVKDETFPQDEETRMPLYIDAEAEAWAALAEIGVPPHLRMLRLQDLELAAATAPADVNLILFERGGGQGTFHFEVREPRREADGPAPEYSVFVEDRRILVDYFLIKGKLETERVDRLLDLLEAISRRKKRPEGHAYMPALTFLTDDPEVQRKAREFIHKRHAERGGFSYQLLQT